VAGEIRGHGFHERGPREGVLGGLHFCPIKAKSCCRFCWHTLSWLGGENPTTLGNQSPEALKAGH
jgi:hypothetical protein